MLRTRNLQPSLWESVLPEVCLRLPVELERVDGWLDDERFFAPFVPFFDPRFGRPSIPMETYLRLMFLKFRYRLGYESLRREVSDSISWQRFCRIPFGTQVPHGTTLMKISTRCGEDAVAGLNEAPSAKAAAAKLPRTDKVRAGTTVVGAALAHRPIRIHGGAQLPFARGIERPPPVQLGYACRTSSYRSCRVGRRLTGEAGTQGSGGRRRHHLARTAHRGPSRSGHAEPPAGAAGRPPRC